MFEKVRHPFKGKNLSTKTIVAYVLFGAIILVFALFGIANPDRMGMGTSGGAAAVVNDASITISEYRQRVEAVERNSKLPFDKLPAEQREMYTKQIRQRTLEQMIMAEVVYQTAFRQGVWASNGQIRDELLGIPVFQDGGRFVRSRYDNYLSQVGLSSDDFERQIRKDIVIRRMQEMFQSANIPSSQEVDHLLKLNADMVNFRFVELAPSKLASEKAISDSDVSAFLQDAAHQTDIKKYYDQHALDYTVKERVKARHILLLTDEKHPAEAVAEKAKALKAKLTVNNFASIAEKESQDPGSAKKGGDLGFFEKGRMVPQFEQAAFETKPGQISEPIKSDYGYHIIYVEKHEPGRTIALDEAKAGIAKKLLAQANVPKVMETLKKAAESGKSSDVDASLKKAGLTWEKAENVVLASPQIAGMPDPQEALIALAKQKGKPGLIPGLVGSPGHSYIIDVVSWKTNPKTRTKDELEKTLAQQESSDSFEEWVKDASAKASVTRNNRLFER